MHIYKTDSVCINTVQPVDEIQIFHCYSNNQGLHVPTYGSCVIIAKASVKLLQWPYRGHYRRASCAGYGAVRDLNVTCDCLKSHEVFKSSFLFVPFASCSVTVAEYGVFGPLCYQKTAVHRGTLTAGVQSLMCFIKTVHTMNLKHISYSYVLLIVNVWRFTKADGKAYSNYRC